MEYLNIGLHHLHNFLRWALLLAGFWSIYLAYTGVSKKRTWENKDQKAGMWFILFCHLQIVLGFILYFYIGYQSVFSNMGESMKNTELRYWGMEHMVGMIIGVALIQYGRIQTKKSTIDLVKHRKALIWYSVGMLIILFNIPWPWSTISRTLFPGM